MIRFAAVLFVFAGAAFVGCAESSSPAPSDPGDGAAQRTVHEALTACMRGRPGPAIAQLDTLVASRPDDVDALATRGMCHRVRFASDSARADAEAAMRDLTAAIERVDAGADPSATSLDRLYAHRAYVHESLSPGEWTGTIADLQRAIRAAPGEATHRLDLGVARSLAGDTAGAVADLRRFLAMVPRDSVRGPVVRRHLAALGDTAALDADP